MIGRLFRRDDGGRGFLARLRGDRRGNTLAIMAAMLIPMCGMVGGGIDISRMYIVKTRMQHACDAGALAGRKAMGSGTWAQSGNMPRTRAEQFYDGNFPATSYGSTATSRAFTEDAGTVTGTASATVPMTLMRVLGKTAETITVTCEAEMRLPNTDVMFVLDTTGSMNDIPIGDTDTKMASLKVAVKCFYEIVARLDTNAVCTTGDPSGGTGNQVQVRFGFVPYATNVNVGKLLPTSYFADTWNYQTRVARTGTTTTNGTPSMTGSSLRNPDPRSWATASEWNGVTSAWCNGQAVPPDSAFTGVYAEGSPTESSTTGGNPSTTTWATYQYGWQYGYRRTYDSGQSRCRIERRQVYGDLRRQYSRTDTTTTNFQDWRYASLPVNVGLLKNGAAWNDSFQWPVGSNGSLKTIGWEGCIEERATVRTTDFDPIPTGANDLNIDLVPTSDSGTKWGPALPDVIYTRQSIVSYTGTFGWNLAEIATTADYANASYYACPVPARKMQAWPDAGTFSTYVDSLTPEGNTYHDIGLLWGARLASPTGIFASENALTPQGGEIDRHIIFMTDGDACTATDNYTAYGVTWFDRRQTDPGTVPTGGCTETGNLTQQVNLRTEALCTAIKNKNITLWVIAFGNLATTTETRLEDCATDARYFKATNAATLQQTFKNIADQISALRITK